MSLQQLREELAANNKVIAGIFEEAGPDRDFTKVKSLDGSTTDKVAEVQRLNAVSTDLGKRIDETLALDGIEASAKSAPRSLVRVVGGEDVVGSPSPKGVKSFDQMFDESPFVKGNASAIRGKSFEYEGTLPQALNSLKATLLLTDINNEATRLPGIVPSAQEDRTVADLLLQGTTDNNTLSIVTETTFTNAAATVAEAAAKPESTLDFTRTTLVVEKIATWIPATDELLEDVAGIRSYIENRLIFMVKRHEEVQLLTGTGTTPQIRGLNNATGIQTQAKGADPTPDAVYKAMTKIRNTGFAEPTFYVTHPNDWQDVKLLRTADGIYIWGSPSAPEGPDRIWGLEVRVTTAQTENTGLVGSREYAQIFRRKGITVTASTEHASYFINNLVALLAEERLTLAIYRGAAFCTVTGI
jgi:hypothetical protein